MKRLIRAILQQLKLFEAAERVIYWFTRFDPNSTHPRRAMVRFYSQFIKKDDLCFDIGAGKGSRTKVFLELKARVICIEPQETYLNELYRRFGKNKRANIVAGGVADREGFLELSICENEPRVSTMSDRFKNDSIFAKEYGYVWKRVEKVPVTTLDVLISQYGMPAFCKIDVEGFEVQVLRGLTKPISLISFEFTADFFDDMERCINRLLQVGNYRFNFAIAEPTNRQGLVLPQWGKPDELYKELGSLKTEDPRIWGDIYAKLF
ncbi:MAG: FkbM family methyltransferase [Candidatus Omnitrophota bacterium]|nr:MAG: FkbM family methyltransferase [Candidatus Omnitrophota bacterium]